MFNELMKLVPTLRDRLLNGDEDNITTLAEYVSTSLSSMRVR